MSFIDSLTAFFLVVSCEAITAAVILGTVRREELACIIRRVSGK